MPHKPQPSPVMRPATGQTMYLSVRTNRCGTLSAWLTNARACRACRCCNRQAESQSRECDSGCYGRSCGACSSVCDKFAAHLKSVTPYFLFFFLLHPPPATPIPPLKGGIWGCYRGVQVYVCDTLRHYRDTHGVTVLHGFKPCAETAFLGDQPCPYIPSNDPPSATYPASA
jgi:hypothetical protein